MNSSFRPLFLFLIVCFFLIGGASAASYQSFAVISTDIQEDDVVFLESNFNAVARSNNNQWAKLSTEIPFNGSMFIDLGGSEEGHTNPTTMTHIWWYQNYGYLRLNFKNSDGEIIHAFAFEKMGHHNSGYLKFDGETHTSSAATYLSDIFGYISVKDQRLDYQGEYFHYVDGRTRGFDSKSWAMDNYDQITSVEISLGTISAYWEGFSRIPIYIFDSEPVDSDGDGVKDPMDSFPNDPNESLDTDLDGTGNNEDTDDDNDGVSDEEELRDETDPLDKESFHINEAPTANAGSSDITLSALTWVEFTGVGADSDGKITSFEWKEGDEVLGTAPWFTYKPTTAGEHRLTFTVTDDDGATASDTFVVTILEDTSVDLSNGLVAHYEFEGDATDSSGYDNHGTAKNGVQYASGVLGQGAVFSDTKEIRIEVADSASLNTHDAFSLSLWVNPTADIYNGHSGILIQKLYSSEDWAGGEYSLGIANDGSIYFSIYNYDAATVRDTINTTNIIVNQWTYVTASFDRGIMSLYLNGELASSKLSTVTQVTTKEYSYDGLRMGNIVYNTYNNGWLIGSLDEVRVYNRALNPSEVKALYEAGAAAQKTISGKIRNDEGAGVDGINVKFEYLVNGVEQSETTITDTSGYYELSIDKSNFDDAAETTYLIYAYRDGYHPATETLQISSEDSYQVDFVINPIKVNEVVLEIEPKVHHLGDDSYSGSVNSQFQKVTEGTQFSKSFDVSALQYNGYEKASLSFKAKGIQTGGTLSVNGSSFKLAASPTDGSYMTYTIELEKSSYQLGSNDLTVSSLMSGFLDYDDFEFANIVLTLSGVVATDQKNISGTIKNDEGISVEGINVKFEYLVNGVEQSVTTITDTLGTYELSIDKSYFDDTAETTYLIYAYRDGYHPATETLQISSDDSYQVDFVINPIKVNEVVLEIEPKVHHLGDDSYSGSVNSQFQKVTEGTQFSKSFDVSALQYNGYEKASLSFKAKGIQTGGTLSVNGSSFKLAASPTDGSYMTYTIELEKSSYQLGSNDLTVSSLMSGFLDYDDFEFANIVLTLSGVVVTDNDGDGIENDTDTDDDNDGMPDVWELANGLDPLDASDAAADADGDNVTNLDEYRANTNPQSQDTDGDGIIDNQDGVFNRGLWGYACNVVNDPDSDTRRWGINQYSLADLPNAVAEPIYGVSKNRTIQSVACTPSGDTILFSMKDSVRGDYEIYELETASGLVTQITDNDTDDADVTRSRDGHTVAWQMRLADGRQALELRQYQDNGEFTSMTLASAHPFVQPSLSPNGKWLTFVQLRPSSFAVMRYDIVNGTYKEARVIARRKKLYHPSITDDGNKIGWSERTSMLRYRVKDLAEDITTDVVYDVNGVEHAVLSGDGKHVIYSVNTPSHAQTYLTALDTLDTSVVGETLANPLRYLSNNWLGSLQSSGFELSQVTGRHLRSINQSMTFWLRNNGSGVRYTLGSDDEVAFTWELNGGVVTIKEEGTHARVIRLLAATGNQFTVSMISSDGQGGVVRQIDTLYQE